MSEGDPVPDRLVAIPAAAQVVRDPRAQRRRAGGEGLPGGEMDCRLRGARPLRLRGRVRGAGPAERNARIGAGAQLRPRAHRSVAGAALGRVQELCILIDTYWNRMNLQHVPVYYTTGLAVCNFHDCVSFAINDLFSPFFVRSFVFKG